MVLTFAVMVSVSSVADDMVCIPFVGVHRL